MTIRDKCILQSLFLLSHVAFFLDWFGFGSEAMFSGFHFMVGNIAYLIGVILFETILWLDLCNVKWSASGYPFILFAAFYEMMTWHYMCVTGEISLKLSLQVTHFGFWLSIISLLVAWAVHVWYVKRRI